MRLMTTTEMDEASQQLWEDLTAYDPEVVNALTADNDPAWLRTAGLTWWAFKQIRAQEEPEAKHTISALVRAAFVAGRFAGQADMQLHPRTSPN